MVIFYSLATNTTLTLQEPIRLLEKIEQVYVFQIMRYLENVFQVAVGDSKHNNIIQSIEFYL